MKGNLGLHDALPISEFKIVPPKGEIWINEKLKQQERKQVVKHEKFENYLMTKKGLTYSRAHKIAQKWEKH
jgi:hypothetical protein